jgi:hypothetical protein
MSRDKTETVRPYTYRPIATDWDALVSVDRIEFWVRFGFGALAGMLIAGALTLVILGGIGAARGCDDVWRAIFNTWWSWP